MQCSLDTLLQCTFAHRGANNAHVPRPEYVQYSRYAFNRSHYAVQMPHPLRTSTSPPVT